MFARACHRALRTNAVRSAIRDQPSYHSAFHNFASPAIQRVRPIQHISHTLHSARRNASTRAAVVQLFKEYPFSVSLASVIILFGLGMLIYINYIYQTYIVGDFKAYPEPVAAKLRRALYYSNIDIQPKNAVKYYRQALALSDEMGLDPFSDEILGVKIQLASFFEKIHMYQKAVDVLEIVRGDCLRWLEQLGGKPGNERKRTKVLGKTIGISIRLGDYYSDAQIDNQEAAEERLVWAVTAMLKEQKRRENGGVKEGDEQWMSNEEIGGALESLGSHYEAKNQHYLAAPLFLQALGLCPATSCHSVVLMNNLAVSLAQQNPPPSLAPNQPPAAAASNLSSARQWALKSLALAASIKPPERNEECDEGCAVATINLGDFAAMEGDIAEAKRRYEEGKGISKGIGFRRGVQRVEEVLRGVEKKI